MVVDVAKLWPRGGFFTVLLFGTLVSADPLGPFPSDHLPPPKCELKPLAAHLATPDGAAIPADGGVLVDWAHVAKATQQSGDPSQPSDWRFEVRGKQLRVSPLSLAPGVSVYRPKLG